MRFSFSFNGDREKGVRQMKTFLTLVMLILVAVLVFLVVRLFIRSESDKFAKNMTDLFDAMDERHEMNKRNRGR